jgi:hypothetical protein
MFVDCNSLVSVNIPFVTNVGTSTFSGCLSLKKINIASGNTSLLSTFLNCVSLEEAIIPSTLTSISNNGLFQNCKSLKAIVFPVGFSSLGGNNNFATCPSLLEYTFLNTTPPTMAGTGNFTSINAAAKIYVPDASVAAYQAATNWTLVASYIYPLSTKP